MSEEVSAASDRGSTLAAGIAHCRPASTAGPDWASLLWYEVNRGAEDSCRGGRAG